MLSKVKIFLKEVIDLCLLVVALGVILQVIFRSSVPFIGGEIVNNMLSIIAQLGDGGLVGLIALGIIVYLINKQAV